LACCGVVVTLAAAPGVVEAQNPPLYLTPRLLTVFPCGGKAGTEVEVTVSGSDLDEASDLYFSHPGLKAQRVPVPDKPGEFQPNKFRVAIAPEVPLGLHDVRVICKYGISNPRAFAVGDLPEVVENEPNNDLAQAHKIELGTTVNGVISPNTDVDYFAFAGKQGQRVVVACLAGHLDSRLDPHVQLFAPGQPYPLASNRRYDGRNAVLDAVLPRDGDYLIRVVQHTHLSGGNDHFYRLSVSLAPWIDAAWPPLVEPGKPAAITLWGRNLPNGTPDPQALLDGRPLDRVSVEVPASGDPGQPQTLLYHGPVPPPRAVLDGVEYRVRNAAGASPPVLLAFARAPIVLDNQDNDTPDKAQPISLPCELCGRIEKLRDRDWYQFSAKAGEVYVLEAFASRLGAPVDLYFEIRRLDDKGQAASLGEFDDANPAEMAHPVLFPTASDDPRTRFVVPADGTYQLLVASRDADLSSGPRHIYRLSLLREQPDFRLVVVDFCDHDPSATLVRQGSSQYLHVLCLREGGFAGEVTLSVQGLPAGVTCPPQTLGPNEKLTALVLTAAEDAPAWQGTIQVVGTAQAAGQTLTRTARAGCVVWSVPMQSGIPALSRLARSLCLAVADKGPFALDCEPREAAVPIGGTLTAKVKIARHQKDVRVPVQLSALAAPKAPNAQFQNQLPVLATLAPDKDDVEVKLTVPNNVPPGTYNVVLRGLAQVPFAKDPKAQKQNHNFYLAAPPVKLVVYNQVADVVLPEASVQVKAGGEKELVVKVQRKYGYQGELKVSLVRPQNLQSVTAAEVTIPQGADEARLVLKAAANAPEASSSDFKVRAVATLNNVPLTQEANLTVAVVK
jgi:hypothetical protein